MEETHMIGCISSLFIFVSYIRNYILTLKNNFFQANMFNTCTDQRKNNHPKRRRTMNRNLSKQRTITMNPKIHKSWTNKSHSDPNSEQYSKGWKGGTMKMQRWLEATMTLWVALVVAMERIDAVKGQRNQDSGCSHEEWHRWLHARGMVMVGGVKKKGVSLLGIS